MAKLERRLAFYADGTISEGKTLRKTFDTNNLVGVVSVFDDGTREDEGLRDTKLKAAEDVDHQIAQHMFKAHLEFKHDGGDTPEIRRLRNLKRGISHVGENA